MMRRNLRRGWVVAVLAALLASVGAGAAWAFWSSTDSTHAAQAAADALPAGQTPSVALSASAGVTTATITFDRSTTTSGRTVSAFVISRYSAASGGSAVQTLPCTVGGTGTPVSCSEVGVPAGTWYYSDTPVVAGSSWQGAESARSSAVTTDTTAPGVTYAQSPTANPAGFNTTSVSVTLTATDSGSGVDFISYTLDGTPNSVHGSAATLTVSGEGTHTLSYSATDNAGNASALQTQTIKIDSTPPGQPVVTSVPAYINIANRTSISIGGTAEAGSTVALSLADGVSGHTVTASGTATGGNWSFTVNPSGLDDGQVSVNVTATDAAGNVSTPPTQTAITKDTGVPSVSASAVGPSSGTAVGFVHQGGTYYVYANAADAQTAVGTLVADVSALTTGATGVSLATAGGPWVVSGTSYAYRSSLLTANATLAEGARSFTVTATDTAGNPSAPSSGSVTVDNTAPAKPGAPDLATSSDSGASTTDNITSVTKPTFTGTTDAGTTVTLYDGSTALDSARASGGTYSITLSKDLADGAHTLTAKATDSADNVSLASAALSVTIDTTAPVPASLLATNSGKSGQIDHNGPNCDTLDFTYTDANAINPGSIVSGWDGTTAQTVQVTFTDGGAANDSISVPGIGTVNLGSTAWLTATSTAPESITRLSATSYRITITKDPSGNATGVAASTFTWSTSGASAADIAGNVATGSVAATGQRF